MVQKPCSRHPPRSTIPTLSHPLVGLYVPAPPSQAFQPPGEKAGNPGAACAPGRSAELIPDRALRPAERAKEEDRRRAQRGGALNVAQPVGNVALQARRPTSVAD